MTESDREMPATFRARLDAALARPVLLDPTALESVRAAAGFPMRADVGSSPSPAQFDRQGDVAVVSIEGPLAQRAWSCWIYSGDGYDSIQQRVQSALDDPSVSAVVLRIDSPGGEVAGCFECLRAMRAAADSSGKPVVAFADELAASAAYAMACAADAIVVPDTGIVGSVGVITIVGDRVGANQADGLNLRVVRSGAMKAVPHPDEPLTDIAIARVQADIDALAQIFANEVAKARGMSAQDVLAQQADVFLGEQAVSIGMADRVGNMNDALAMAREMVAKRIRRSSAAAQDGKKRVQMEAIAKALGLPPDASESDILVTIAAKQRDEQTAASTIEALTRDVAEANATAEKAEKRVAEIERAKLMSEIKAARKWSQSLDAFLGTQSLAQLESWLATAPAVVPEGEIRPPTTPASADAQLSPDIAALAAKGWKNLESREKDLITRHDPKLAERLRNAAE